MRSWLSRTLLALLLVLPSCMTSYLVDKIGSEQPPALQMLCFWAGPATVCEDHVLLALGGAERARLTAHLPIISPETVALRVEPTDAEGQRALLQFISRTQTWPAELHVTLEWLLFGDRLVANLRIEGIPEHAEFVDAVRNAPCGASAIDHGREIPCRLVALDESEALPVMAGRFDELTLSVSRSRVIERSVRDVGCCLLLPFAVALDAVLLPVEIAFLLAHAAIHN